MLARLQKSREKMDEWRVESAGTWAQPGQPAALNAQNALAVWGIDLSRHRSQLVSRIDLEMFNLILTMEEGHQEALRVEFPTVAKRVFMLSEMTGSRLAVPDPYGEDEANYQATAKIIDDYLERGMKNILLLAAGG